MSQKKNYRIKEYVHKRRARTIMESTMVEMTDIYYSIEKRFLFFFWIPITIHYVSDAHSLYNPKQSLFQPIIRNRGLLAVIEKKILLFKTREECENYKDFLDQKIYYKGFTILKLDCKKANFFRIDSENIIDRNGSSDMEDYSDYYYAIKENKIFNGRFTDMDSNELYTDLQIAKEKIDSICHR